MQIAFKHSCNSIKSGKNKFIINSKFEVDKLILSVGGNAYSSTGSAGDDMFLQNNLDIQ
jgi:predicted flavoprotein YhiN